jgi:hypothetical protein|nr:MAG TPA: hypothetical protein [Bacteriophage sp.]
MKRKKPRILDLNDIQNIRNKDLYFVIEYKDSGNTYCDTLHNTEICADHDTANSVTKITPLNDNLHFAPLYGLNAIKFIKKLTYWNTANISKT